MFTVQTRNKKLELSREEILEKHKYKLMEYYINLAKEKGIYWLSMPFILKDLSLGSSLGIFWKILS